MGCKTYFYSGAYQPMLKRSLNIDQLFSIYLEPKLIIETIEYKRAHPEYTGKIMVDSGAFSFYQQAKKKGVELTQAEKDKFVDEYIDFLNEWGDDLFCFVAVDTVPNPDDVDQSFADLTWENYLYMWPKLKPSIRHKLIPVFHYGEDWKHLHRFLEHVNPDGTHIDYIGLAISLEGTKKVRISWGQECMRIIANSSNPNVKTHAFGVGVKSVLDHIDVYSTDATSWVKRAAYGMISINDKTIYISDIQKQKLKGSHYTEKSTSYSDAVVDTIHERGFLVHPYEVDYVAGEDSATFTTKESTVSCSFNGDLKLTVDIRKGDSVDTREFELIEGVDGTDEELDKFAGTWRHTDGKWNMTIIFDGKGNVSFDPGTSLATNCYARARFNILDTEMWMEEQRHKNAKTLPKTKNLGW